MRRKTMFWGFCLIIVSVMSFTGCSVSGEDILSEEGNLIIQGNVKTSEVNLNSKIAGNVVEILVKEGQEVKAGDVLIQISSETLQAKKAQSQAVVEAAKGQYQAAESARAAAQAQYDKALNGARNEEVEQAKLAYDLATKTYERIKALYEEGACPESTFDEASTKYEITKQQYELAQQGARNEDKLSAKASVDQASAAAAAAKGSIMQAEGSVAEVNSYLEDTIIKAPSGGFVTAINTEVGELISTGMPLATITNNDSPKIELNVKETDLGQIKLNEKVKVKFAAYEGKEFEGVVESINKKPDFATKRATNNNGEFDVLSFGVKVSLTNLDVDVYPGMTALVDFGKKSGK